MSSQRKFLDKLSGKRVLIFGGTSGIGFAVAEAAVEYGAHVIISSSSPDKVQNAVKQLSTSYPEAANRIFGQPCDLGNVDALEANIEATFKFATEDGTKKLDHIVHTAGGPQMGALADVTPTKIYAAQTIRVVAPAIMAKLIPKYANVKEESSFTCTNGGAVYKPPPGFVLSCIGGRGVEGLITSLAVELKPLRVNLITPGIIVTDAMKAALAIPGLKAKMENATLNGTFGKPEDTAEAYLYVMKDHFVTGSVIHTNGGAFLKF